jgi:hypothetical protein
MTLRRVCEHVEGDEAHREGKVSICSPVEASRGLRQSLSSVCLSVEQRRSWVKKHGGSLCQTGMRSRIYKRSMEEAALGAAWLR